jgi:predicted transcriptional regulator
MFWKLPSVHEIVAARKQLEISQNRLAKDAAVSQAMINKFEREQVDMGYSKVIRVCDVLLRAFNQQIQKSTKLSNLYVKDIMEPEVVGVQANDKVIIAVNLMTKYGFSQLPVMRNNQPVGSITERILKNHLDRGINPEQLRKKVVESIMGPPFPEVSQDTILEAASIMLESCEAIIVRVQEKIVGMITAADFMKLARTSRKET